VVRLKTFLRKSNRSNSYGSKSSQETRLFGIFTLYTHGANARIRKHETPYITSMRFLFFPNWRVLTYAIVGVIGTLWMLAPNLGHAQVMNPTSSMPMPTSSFPQPVGITEEDYSNLAYPYGMRGLSPSLTTVLYAIASLLALLGLFLVIAGFERRPHRRRKVSPAVH
jgi:hypothetical protein